MNSLDVDTKTIKLDNLEIFMLLAAIHTKLKVDEKKTSEAGKANVKVLYVLKEKLLKLNFENKEIDDRLSWFRTTKTY